MTQSISFEAIGTSWQIDFYDDLSLESFEELQTIIKERIDVFDRTYSRFRSDSLVTRMAQHSGKYEMPEDASLLFSLYRQCYEITNGVVTPLIGQVLVDAGYDASYALRQHRALTVPPAWDDVMEYHYPILTIKTPVLLDVGAAGKGYLVDIVATLLEENGVAHFCVDAGGDMIHRGTTPIRVGLEHSTDSTKVIGIIELCNKSLCGSSGNRRRWENFHHIINPKTLASAEDILAVWVLADTTMLADMLATALFFMPASTFKEYSFEYLIVRPDHSIEKSDGFECMLL